MLTIFQSTASGRSAADILQLFIHISDVFFRPNPGSLELYSLHSSYPSSDLSNLYNTTNNESAWWELSTSRWNSPASNFAKNKWAVPYTKDKNHSDNSNNCTALPLNFSRRVDIFLSLCASCCDGLFFRVWRSFHHQILIPSLKHACLEGKMVQVCVSRSRLRRVSEDPSS